MVTRERRAFQAEGTASANVPDKGEHGVLKELTRGQGGWIWGVEQNAGRVGRGELCRNCGLYHSSALMPRAIGSYRVCESRNRTHHDQIWAGRELDWKGVWGAGNPGKREAEVQLGQEGCRMRGGRRLG